MSIYVFVGMSVNANPGRACLNLILFKKEYHNLGKVIISIDSLAYPDYFVDASIAGIHSDRVSLDHNSFYLIRWVWFYCVFYSAAMYLSLNIEGLCYVKVNDKPVNSISNVLLLISGISLTVISMVAATLSLLEEFGVVDLKS